MRGGREGVGGPMTSNPLRPLRSPGEPPPRRAKLSVLSPTSLGSPGISVLCGDVLLFQNCLAPISFWVSSTATAWPL
jgi:hypothetical protein